MNWAMNLANGYLEPWREPSVVRLKSKLNRNGLCGEWQMREKTEIKDNSESFIESEQQNSNNWMSMKYRSLSLVSFHVTLADLELPV